MTERPTAIISIAERRPATIVNAILRNSTDRLMASLGERRALSVTGEYLAARRILKEFRLAIRCFGGAIAYGLGFPLLAIFLGWRFSNEPAVFGIVAVSAFYLLRTTRDRGEARRIVGLSNAAAGARKGYVERLG